MVERSLVLMKPDAVKRGIVGEILHRFERAGLKIIAAKMLLPNAELASKHYPDTKEWKQKVGTNTLEDCEKYGLDVMETMGTTNPVKIGEMIKQWNIGFLTSGPVLALVFEGMHAVERIRSLVGATVPVMAAPGTIRSDFSLESVIEANRARRTIYNLIHASGSVEEAEHEIRLWFKDDEIMKYKRVQEDLYSN